MRGVTIGVATVFTLRLLAEALCIQNMHSWQETVSSHVIETTL